MNSVSFRLCLARVGEQPARRARVLAHILLSNMPTAIQDAVLLNADRVPALRAVARTSRRLPALTHI